MFLALSKNGTRESFGCQNGGQERHRGPPLGANSFRLGHFGAKVASWGGPQEFRHNKMAHQGGPGEFRHKKKALQGGRFGALLSPGGHEYVHCPFVQIFFFLGKPFGVFLSQPPWMMEASN